MRFAGLVATKAERLQQDLPLVYQLLCYERPDPDHLVAVVVRVGDDVGVLAEGFEDREAVWREAADASGRFFKEESSLGLEALLECESADVHLRIKSSPTTKSGLSGP